MHSLSDIPGTLDQLAVRRESQDRRLPRRDGGYKVPSIDVLLATNKEPKE
jgi:hypothetical protein